jgi:hypothetical protein
MIDAVTLTGADESVAQWSAEGACQGLVATVSHCHGALGMLTIE